MIKRYSENLKKKFPIKEEFKKRMEYLLGKSGASQFFEISYTQTPPSIRCNTLKISPTELIKRLKSYGWKVHQPFPGFPEVIIIKNKLEPGELGKSKEHLLGYFYIQEISSMLPVMALEPKPHEIVLDLCASPGSKTTQAAAMMENKGVIIANDVNVGRISILNSNLERCGVSNVIVTRKEGVALCNTFFKKSQIRFDKILVDAPCSGEGTLRKSPKTFLMWNLNMIKKIASTQRKLTEAAFNILKEGGTMVYSTCTLAPEENEFIVQNLVEKFNAFVEKVNLPLKTRQGISSWGKTNLSPQIKNCARLYPQDNNTDGFFVAKIRKISNNYEK